MDGDAGGDGQPGVRGPKSLEVVFAIPRTGVYGVITCTSYRSQRPGAVPGSGGVCSLTLTLALQSCQLHRSSQVEPTRAELSSQSTGRVPFSWGGGNLSLTMLTVTPSGAKKVARLRPIELHFVSLAVSQAVPLLSSHHECFRCPEDTWTCQKTHQSAPLVAA